MAAALTAEEQLQLTQTIEMFEVITEGQNEDYQSLEILKEAYVKLGRDPDVLRTSKRIAEAYLSMGQLSLAIMEYESLAQRYPDDAAVQLALKDLNARAGDMGSPASEDTLFITAPVGKRTVTCIDDGSKGMKKTFVDGKLISQQDFDLYWEQPNYELPPGQISLPFIQNLAEKGVLPVERSLKALLEKSRIGFVPLGRYEVDGDTARQFDGDVCRRWCIMPFDRMSKTILVATANPFNQQASADLEQLKSDVRFVFYLANPQEIMKSIRSTYR